MTDTLRQLYVILNDLESLIVRQPDEGSGSEVLIHSNEVGIGVGAKNSSGLVFVREYFNESQPSNTPSFRTISAIALSVKLDRQGGELPSPENAFQFLTSSTIVANDASPDSVLALVIFLIRKMGGEFDSLKLNEWIEAAEVWKSLGNITGRPEQSWCALHAAGVHAYFESTRTGLDEYEMGRAWLSAARFITHCLIKGFAPNEIPLSATSSEHRSFLAALEREEVLYHSWLEHAEIIQLRLPLKSSADRYRLVDALIFEENDPTGAAKVFYRNDKINAPLKRGFDVAFSFRRYSKAGNRYVVSANPDAGVTLEPIWRAFEAAECAEWLKLGEERPSDLPRNLPGVEDNKWNEPWWNGGGDFQFLAEPRHLPALNGQPNIKGGTLLSWKALREIVWGVCNPVKTIKVHAGSGSVVPNQSEEPYSLQSLADRQVVEVVNGKKIVSLKWAGVISEDCSATRTPTVQRFLASLTQPDGGASGLVPSSGIDRDGDYATVPLRGGFATITQDGVVLFDDWQMQPLEKSLLKAVVGASASQAEILDEIASSITKLEARYSEIVNANEGSKKGKKKRSSSLKRLNQTDIEGLMSAVVKLRVRLKTADRQFVSALGEKYSDFNKSPSAIKILSHLEDAWNLDIRTRNYTAIVEGMLSDLQNLLRARSIGIERLLFQLGFAITPAAVLAEPTGNFLAASLRELDVVSAGSHSFWNIQLESISQVCAALGLSILLFLFIRWLANWLEWNSLRD